MSSSLNKFELIASRASFACCLFANTATSEFELRQLDAEMSETNAPELAARNMAFAGIVGIVDGLPRVAFAIELDEAISAAMVRAFIKRMEFAISWVEHSMSSGVD
jgi:hypothetical protein